MSAILRCHSLLVWFSWVLLAGLLATADLPAAAANADSMTLSLDRARVIKLPKQVTTIIIGNPLIADASLQQGGILVVAGKAYGSTNLLAVDRAGHVLVDKTVRVVGPADPDLVVVYRGVKRQTYSCVRRCERTITLGDSRAYFNAALSQTIARDEQTQGSGSDH